MHNKFLPFSVLVLVAGISAVYFFFDPVREGFFLRCPLKSATGLDCPGCGSQRAFHALLHGDFREAVRQNALFVAAVPYVALGLFFPKLRRVLFSGRACIVIVLIMLIFFALRNFGNF